MVRGALYLGVVAALGLYAYSMGEQHAEAVVDDLERRLAEEQGRVMALTEAGATAESRVDAAVARARAFEERLQSEAPQGAERDILRLVRERLGAGLKAERLTTVIAAAQNESRCDEAPISRRFLVQTPLAAGAGSTVAFANGSILVSGSGASAKDDNGNLEAWFDPAQPVTVNFTAIGGEARQIGGMLPLHHSIVIGGNEHRFSIVAGARGFIQVVSDTCRFP